jgi:hypothetical protein
MIDVISLVTAILGLMTALVSLVGVRRHAVLDDQRFRDVHKRLNGDRLW